MDQEVKFQKAKNIYFHDKILAATILKLIPRSIEPNHVTALRFIATPFVVGILLSGYYKIGAILFIITAFTDAIDGSLARTRDQITVWGKLYDPLADKLLVTLVLIILGAKYLSTTLIGSIIFIEVLLIFGAVFVFRHKETQANIWGKIKMICQVLGITLLLLGIIFNIPSLFDFSMNIFIIGIIFGIISVFTYSA